MVEFCIAIFGLFFYLSFICFVAGVVLGAFKHPGAWIIGILVMAVFAQLFADPSSWLMFFPKFVKGIAQTIFHFAKIVFVIYALGWCLSNKKWYFKVLGFALLAGVIYLIWFAK